MAINVFDLYAKLGLDSSGYDSGLDAAKSAAKAAGVAIGASMAAAATGAAALVKQSVSAYAEYEQLVGGVETLFSNLEGTVSAAPQVLANAANAYKTAGMSANEYMDTVTSFSAALIAGLKNDYDAAAKYADMAITDMSDNANKMGTAIESIRTAYAGFAKQNYTMLDNLRLGYGGTKEEMQRLLDDAEKFSGVDYDISNLNDVYEAIHVIQTEMGITGTTAREASETISGSIGMLSGAWTNLVAGFADKEADIPKLIDDVVDSAEIAFNNLLPVTEQAITGLTQFVDNIAPTVVEKIPDIAEQIIPPLLNTASSAVNTLVVALPSMLTSIVDVVPGIITDISKTVIDNAPKLASTGKDLALTLSKGLTDSIPVLVPAAVSSVSEIARTLTEPETLKEILDAGLDIVVTLAESIGDNIPEITDTVFTIAGSVLDVITSPEFGSEIITAGGEIVVALAGGIITAVPAAIGAIVDVMTGVTDRANDPEWQERSETAGAAIVESMSTAFLNNSETFLESVENTLWRVDNLLGTHFEQWYKDFEDFSFDLGKWFWDASAEASGLNDAISEADKQFRVAEMKNAITREFNEAVRAGQDISDAFDTAREAVIKTMSDTNLYYDELYDYFNPDFLQQQAAAVNEAVAANEAAAQAQRDAFEATVAKGKEYERYYTQQVRTINVLNEEQLQGAKAQSDALIDEVQELSEKELAAQQKAADKALAEQQKAAEKALKEQQRAEEKAQKDRERAAEKAQKAQEKAEQAQTKALERAISEREKLLTKYQSDIEKIYENIDKLEAKYEDDVKSRTQDIFNSYSLFEEVPDRIQVSGADLTKNLELQVERMKLFYAELDELAAKGVDERLVEDIRSQGVGALDNLDALLDLSTAELDQYNKLYKDKATFADEQANKEFENKLHELDSMVAVEYDKIDKLTAERSKTIGETFINGIAEGMKNGFGSLTEAATNAIFGGYASQSLINYSDTETGRAEIRKSKVSDTADTSLGAGNIVINVNGIQYQNPAELAEAMSVEIQKQIRREGRAYA